MDFKIAELAIAVPGGILIAGSMIFRNQLLLRVLNFAGSVMFVIYGIVLLVLSNLETGWTSIFLNAATAIINLVWIIKIYKERKQEEKKNGS